MNSIKIKNVTFIHGDCMEYLNKCVENQFDLAIVDPPYGLNKKLLGGETGMMKNCFKSIISKKWDKKPSGKYFDKLLFSAIKCIIWGGNYFIDHLHSTQCLISWDKMNGTNNMADFEIAWTNFDKSCRRFSMHHFSKGYGKKIHPTQKPVKLYEWLLINYAQPGQTILDTHGGSGSIAIACYELGYELTIIEKDKEYFDNMIKRFEQHISQLKLF